MIISGVFLILAIALFAVGIYLMVLTLEEALLYHEITEECKRHAIMTALAFTLGGAAIVFSTPPI